MRCMCLVIRVLGMLSVASGGMVIVFYKLCQYESRYDKETEYENNKLE